MARAQIGGVDAKRPLHFATVKPLFSANRPRALAPNPRGPRDPIAVPAWETRDPMPTAALENSLRNWIGMALGGWSENGLADRAALRLGLGPNTQRRWNSLTEAYAGALVSVPTDELLRVVNTILHVADMPGALPLGELERILDHGGSPFALHRRGPDIRLVHRVDPTESAATAIAAADANGEVKRHLADAWNYAFDFTPDSDKAYACAVKAVEAVAIPILAPHASNPTLGHVLSNLRGQRTANPPTWHLGLPNQQDVPASVETLESMVELLWHGQRSRHGGSATSRSNTPEEAQTAVRLAVLLVGWFTSGAIRQGP
jgi:hypothetical protein